ncbi:porin [Noviherbaspirillum saxi]|nr:porin [Noviherbaspirillum saxi]
MMKPVLALAVLATFAPFCHAQSASNVSMYGVVDAGVAFTDNGAAARSNSVGLSSGVMTASLIGFRGVDDLGNGLKAKFQLEAGFDLDTGAMKTYAGNPSTATPTATGGAAVNGLFNRRSYVGLEGGFGSVTLGRDYTPNYYVVRDTDVMALGLYGNLQQTVALSGTGSERFGRASNAVFYESPDLDGFKARVMVSFGSESAGGAGMPPSDANRMWGASGIYTMGGLVLAGAYQELKLPLVAGTPAAFTGGSSTRKDHVIGAKYTFGAYTLSAGYFLAKQPNNADSSDAWLGASAKIGTGTVYANLQRMKQEAVAGAAATGNVFGLGYVHPMSRRTSLYASYGQLNNSATAAFPLISGDGAVAPGALSADIKALAVGIRHFF